MSKVHYFQRFSQPENVATNNTLLLLSRLYEIDRLIFEKLLGQLLLESAADKIGLQFEQQKSGGGGTIVDGVIKQASLKLVIETKLFTSWSEDQLRGHLQSFTGKEDLAVLVMLSTDPPRQELVDRVTGMVTKYREKISAKSLGLCACTFEKLRDTAEEMFSSDEEAMELLEDYASYLAEAGYLPVAKNLLRVVPCSISFEDNKRWKLYYEPSDRSSQPAEYLGVYAWKAVRLIGKPAKVVHVTLENGKVVSQETLTPEEKDRIAQAWEASKQYGWSGTESRKFTLFDELWPTDFKKISSGGIRRHRNINLKDFLGNTFDPKPEAIADLLKSRTWD